MMNILRKFIIPLLLLLFASLSFATESSKNIRYQQLTEQLRCLVCQNEDLADSDAPLAKDLRQQIQTRLDAGENDQQIIDYLTKRYGEFILFKPSVSNKNLPLWFGPFIILLIGLGILAATIARHRHKRKQKLELSAEEKNKLEQLLK